MEGLDKLVIDLALILGAAGVVTLLFKKLRQPIVLGYIVAGFLVSPHMPYLSSVSDVADIQIWANIGVIFLLFALGLEFSFKKIVKSGMAPVIAACTIIFFMIVVGSFVGHLFGWSRVDCLYLGGMLAMSSTTIIYKSFDDLGMRSHKFAGLVLSVLILEDILAIVLMVVLSTVAVSKNFHGQDLAESIAKLVFFIVTSFVIGLFVVPQFLRSTRKLMSKETLLIVSLALCLFMVYLATKFGFSAAFGAFLMGSILAETVEADAIEKVVAPVKDLFGAIFFVSVGMLVDPAVLAQYALPIIAITLAILAGQALFGSAGFLLAGQPLKTAMQCGFSMAQIGEFAFIIASSGVALGVTSHFLYPIVVAVSVITTFLTPYMMKAALPAHSRVEKMLPRSWKRALSRLSGGSAPETLRQNHNLWRTYLLSIGRITAVYGMVSLAIILIMVNFLRPQLIHLLPGRNAANAFTCAVTILCISPFLRAIVMKKNHSIEFKSLWAENKLNRFPLIFSVFVRFIIAVAFVFAIIHRYFNVGVGALICLAIVLLVLMIQSRRLKRNSIEIERTFMKSLRSREVRAQVMGQRRPLYEGKLLSRDMHFVDFEIPSDSAWVGKTLGVLNLGSKYGIHVISILRGESHRMNIPGANVILYPGDRIRVLGSDDQLNRFDDELRKQLIAPDYDLEKREMVLRRMVIDDKSPFLGKSIREGGFRNVYNCMVVGLESGESSLVSPDVNRPLQSGDVLWLVGEENSFAKFDNVMSIN